MPSTRTTHHIGIEEDMATQAFRHFGKTNTYGDGRSPRSRLTRPERARSQRLKFKAVLVMGLVYVDGVVKHGGKGVKVRFLVDSSATYTVLTKSVWEELGLKPMGEVEFVLADGTVIKRAISETLLELPGYGERHTPVVLGESEDENLLGAVTLEIFGLVLDPSKRELRPARGLMKTTHKITTIGYTASARA